MTTKATYTESEHFRGRYTVSIGDAFLGSVSQHAKSGWWAQYRDGGAYGPHESRHEATRQLIDLHLEFQRTITIPEDSEP